MLLQILIDFETALVTTILGVIPSVTLASIPYIGDTIQSTLLTFVQFMNTFIGVFPYAGIVWHLFIYGVIPFELSLIGMRFLLGGHTPQAIE